MTRREKCPLLRDQRLKVRRGKPHHPASSETKTWAEREGICLGLKMPLYNRQRHKWFLTDLRCSMLGSIHPCGTLTVFGKPVVPDVCSTYANSLRPASSCSTAEPLRSFTDKVCPAPRSRSATRSGSMWIRVSLNLSSSTQTVTVTCLMRAAWNCFKLKKTIAIEIFTKKHNSLAKNLQRCSDIALKKTLILQTSHL